MVIENMDMNFSSYVRTVTPRGWAGALAHI